MSTLPLTDVSKYQDEILYPSGVYENFPEGLPSTEDNGDLTLWIYSSLIHLRVILNGAHNTLYGAKGTSGYNKSNLKDVGTQAQSIANILKMWRNSLPRRLDWKDDEEPSSDINVARLRAKYYGGLYMVLRPFLRIAVGQTSPAKSPGNSLGAASTPTNTTPFANPVSLNHDNFGLVKECIQSAIQSTIAFDRVNAVPGEPYTDYRSQRRGRLILTNIFGTLHAQFGNMILLAAVYKSPLRHQLEAECELNRMNLSALFYRTMKILDEVAPNSPILRMDLKILENVKRELGLS